jgi:hypothetical protein
LIARFRVLLPYAISLRATDEFTPEQFDRDGYRIKVYAPYQAATSVLLLGDPAVPVSDITDSLHPSDPPLVDPTITIDGQPTIRANALQIDFEKPYFDRTAPAEGQPGSNDPPLDLLFEIANSVLLRLRSSGRTYPVHPITNQSSCWRVDFLGDDGQPVAAELGKVRARVGAAFSMGMTGLSAAGWKAATSLSRDFRPKPWEALLLDSEAQLPNITTALILAAAALEAFIASSLIVLAPKDPPASELWLFINDRGDYRKEPSVAEQFDQLLHALAGRSLKDRPELWEAFRNMREARNSVMHDGTLSIGGHPVSREQAFTLIARSKEIVDWIEQVIPTAARRPSVPPVMQIEMIRPVIRPRLPAA